MAKSKIIKVSGNGSWTGEYGTLYMFEYEFEDGTIGLANHQTDTPKYKEGEFIESIIIKESEGIIQHNHAHEYKILEEL